MKALTLITLIALSGLHLGFANEFDLDSEIKLDLIPRSPSTPTFQKRITTWKDGFVVKDTSRPIQEQNLRLDFPGVDYQRLRNWIDSIQNQ